MSKALHSSSWSSFLKSIASFNGDLASLTAPPFILSPTSLCEYSKYWGELPEILVEANQFGTADDASTEEKEAMALKRMVCVTKWFISTLRSQYCSRSESMGSEKKPLNPFLGEVFVGKWSDNSKDQNVGETVLISEQVSHHPPITAYCIYNDKNSIELQGYSGIKATMSATSINVKQYGHAVLEYKDLKESYLITLPPLHIEGLLTASPFVELEGSSYIQSSNGYFTKVDFSGRGYFSGKKNTFKARIYRDALASASKENALITISGQWSGKSYIGRGSETPSSKSADLFYDAHNREHQELIVKDIEKQNDLESRKAWLKVAEAIKSSNYDLINEEKSKIENQQREQRKQEKEAGIEWKTRWFDNVDYDAEGNDRDTFEILANLANLSVKNAPSGSLRGTKYDTGDAKHWRYNPSKWKAETEITI